MKKTLFISIILISILFIGAITPLKATGTTRYKVRPGDTLWEISRTFDTPMELIVENNDLTNSKQLKPGQELLITTRNNQIIISIEDIKKAQETEYTVDWNDSLYLIAQEFGVSVDSIKKRNNLDYEQIYYGQTLIIPGTTTPEDSTENKHYYTVKSGDSLWNIARKNDITIDKLIDLNDIESNFDIYPGQQLLISSDTETPVDEPLYSFYEVQENDRIWQISEQFGLKVSQLLNFNNISPNQNISEGELLIIPLNKTNKYSYLKNTAQKLNNSYRVQPSETLDEIAEYFELPARGLRILNQLEENETVSQNQKLSMPVNPGLFKQHELYKVKDEQEYLFDIAYKKGVSISSILKANYLNDPNTKFQKGTTVLITTDENSQATWIDYEDGKPVDSLFFNY
ncbi:MAG: LysM peptidoglycan-binding domain-containing protein [bacterium]